MTEPDARDPVAAAEGLTRTLQGLTEQFARLQRSERRWRLLVAGLSASLVLDLALTGGLGYNTIRQNDTQSAAHADVLKACALANADRVKDIAVWDDVLALAAPGRRAEAAGIAARVRAKDKLRNCAALYATSP
jgi:hypothetical protein